MPSSFTTRPNYVIPNRPAEIFVIPADGAANFVRLWCTVAPSGSAIDAKIKKQQGAATGTRVLVYSGQPGMSHPWKNTFDKGGDYTLQLQSYARGNGFGGGYTDDPRGAPTETKLGGEETLHLYVSQRMTMPLGTGDDTATLALFLNNLTVIQTIAAVHGETTPAVIEASSDRALTAAYATAVTAEVRDLVGEAATDLASSANYQFGLKDLLDEFVADWNAHLANTGGTYHDNADTVNVIAEAVAPPFPVEMSPEQAITAIAEVLRLMRRHYLNDSGSGPGSTGASPYHGDPDSANLPIVGGVSSLAEAFVAMGDIRRSYEAHRVLGGNVHNPTDTTNTLATLGGASSMLLVAIQQKFMTALAAATVTAPPGQSQGAALLAQYAGMEEG